MNEVIMKIIWTIKNLFINYKALMIILGLEYVFQFTQIEKHNLPQIIMGIYESSVLWGGDLGLVSSLSKLLFQVLTYMILLICISSGVLLIYKKIIHHETYNMGDFVLGIESNWRKVLVTALFSTFTLGLLTHVAQWFLALGLSVDIKFYVYLKAGISTSLRLFYTSIVVYGCIVTIENGFKIKVLFHSVLKFVFSKEALKLLIILLVAGALLQPINILKNHYLFNASLLNGGNLFSFLDTISAPRFPRWVKCIEWFLNTIVTSFILLYTSLTFYHSSSTKTPASKSEI
jgi:hypothetical protein